jgi:hypothetical protein
MGTIFGKYVMSPNDYKADGSVNWRIAIPSYRREKTLLKKTLKTLSEYKVSPDRIDIFVANEDERLIYELEIPQSMYGRIVVGIRGIREIRNFIQSYYNEGDYVLCMDDDIEEVYQVINGEKKPLRDFNSFVEYAFKVCEEAKTRFWGVYAVDNAFFMKEQVSLGLRFLVGVMFGMIVTHDKHLIVETSEKEDYERSIRAYLRYGNVVRFDFIGFKTNYYNEPGGLQGQRSEERITSDALKLIAMFPNQVRKNTRRKNKYFEIELVEQREEKKVASKRKLTLM